MPKKSKGLLSDETVTITRSFSRKLNMSAYGGKQYETADIFCSMTKEVGLDTLEKEAKLLDSLCQKEVNETIEAFTGETPEMEEQQEIKPVKKKKNLDLGIKIEQDELADMQDLVNDLTMAKTASDLKKVVVRIKEVGHELSKTQKEYLSAYYAKRKEVIESNEE